MAEFTEASTERTVREACLRVGLTPDGLELLRLGENAIYRLGHDPVVVRIARTVAYLPDVEKEVAVARWLRAVGLPAVRLAEVGSQPMVAAGRVVTFWEYVQASSKDPTVADLAELLRRLHGLPIPEGVPLKPLDPFYRIQARLQNATAVPAEDMNLLRDWYGDLRTRYSGLDFQLPLAVIHGDANIGNVIRQMDGEVLLIDLDNFAIGPPEWDLTLTATYYSNFRWHSAGEYQNFAETYGFDVLNWPGFPVLRDIRELHMVSWLMQNVAQDPRVAAEFRKRIETIRAGVIPRGWEPF